MNKILFFPVALLILISCNTKKHPLTVKEFTKKYYDSLVSRFPKEKFTISDDSTIKSGVSGNELIISVDNAYKEYQFAPDSLTEVITRYVSSSNEIFSPAENINAENIIPIIKPTEFLNGIKEMANKSTVEKNTEIVYDKYNSELVIAYAEDRNTSIKYLLNTDLKTLSIERDSLKKLAIKNLDKLLTNIQSSGGDGLYMITAGGNYEASTILLNIINKENFKVKGEFVIAIPNRDLLLVTGSKDQAGIEKLQNMIKDSYQTGTYPISDKLFKWNGKIFEKYD